MYGLKQEIIALIALHQLYNNARIVLRISDTITKPARPVKLLVKTAK